MNTFQSEQIIKILNATQIKSLLRLTETPYTSKMNKEELVVIAIAKPEITPAIIINHLKLDKFILEKKINSPTKPRKKKVVEISPPENKEVEEVSSLIETNLEV